MTRIGLPTRIAVGAVCGLAWAAGLRAWMSELTGYSTFSWAGTFIGILLPGVVVGAAVGAATALDAGRRRQRTALRWCAAAVMAFAVFPLLLPDQLQSLLTTGLGGGAIGVALAGLAGGYAIGGRRTWLRVLCAVDAVVTIVAVMAIVPILGASRLAVTSPRGVWAMLLAGSLLVVLCLAAAIPFRRLSAVPGAAGVAVGASQMAVR